MFNLCTNTPLIYGTLLVILYCISGNYCSAYSDKSIESMVIMQYRFLARFTASMYNQNYISRFGINFHADRIFSIAFPFHKYISQLPYNCGVWWRAKNVLKTETMVLRTCKYQLFQVHFYHRLLWRHHFCALLTGFSYPVCL